MRKAVATWLLCSCLCGNASIALAVPIGPVENPRLLVIPVAASGFKGTIPTEAHPLRGEARLASMRRAGRLPDTFVRGRCTYNLAGDPEVAYYVKTCR
jgi:hypothetical protein